MKPQNLRIILVATVSLAAGSALTAVLAQQGSPVPATQPAGVSPAAVPASASPATVPTSTPPTVEPTAPVAEAAPVEAAAEPATAPTNPSTGPSATPATTPSAGPATAPSAGPATRPVDGGSSRYGSSRYGRSSSREGDGRSEPATRPSTPDVATVTIPPTKPIDKKYEVLLARSLFSKERPRPPVDYTPKATPSGPVTPPTPPAPEKSMAVRGLSIEGEGEEDDAFYAFIEDLPLKMMKRVKVGDKIARGIVAEVTLADMVYEFEGKRTRVPIGHTLDGAPAPAVTWSTYVPVAAAPPPGSRGGDPRSGGDSRGGDSRGGDPRSSGDSRGGDSRGGDSRGSGDSRGGPTPSGGPTPPAPTPAPSPAPVASTEAPAVTPATAPATPAATGTPAAGAGDDLLERMRRRREQEGGR